MPGYTREIRVELQPYTNHCAPFSYTQGYGRIGHPKLLAYHGLPTRYNLDDIQLYRGAHHSVLPTGLHVLFPRSANPGFPLEAAGPSTSTSDKKLADAEGRGSPKS